MNTKAFCSQRLRELREERGWTKNHLAVETGLDPTFLGRVERGMLRMSLDTAMIICQALGVSLSEFDPPMQVKK